MMSAVQVFDGFQVFLFAPHQRGGAVRFAGQAVEPQQQDAAPLGLVPARLLSQVEDVARDRQPVADRALIETLRGQRTAAIVLGLGFAGLAYSAGGGADEASQTLTYTLTGIPSHITVWLADGTTYRLTTRRPWLES